MWQPINDCGKQLNIEYKIRQTVKNENIYVTEYKITDIETDQYHLHLVSKSKNGIEVGPDPNEVLVFTCEQIIKYQFEVWIDNEKPVGEV